MLQLLQQQECITEELKADVAAGFQQAVVDTLLFKSRKAMQANRLETLVIAGGVGANKYLRESAAEMTERFGFKVCYPSRQWCTDNAAMVAVTGALRYEKLYSMDYAIKVLPRWSLQELDK